MTDKPVGYGNPPSHARFKKGSSGNPRGRPRGSTNLKSDLAAELGTGTFHDEIGLVSKQRGIIKALVAKAEAGDFRAAALLLGLSERLLQTEDDATEADSRTFDALIEGTLVTHGHGDEGHGDEE